MPHKLATVLKAFEALRYSLPSIGGKALADFNALELALREAQAPKDPLDLEPIKARLAAATQGPWYHRQANEHRPSDPKDAYDWIGDHPAQGKHKKVIVGRNALYGGVSDYIFIANAPADIAALIGEVERLTHEHTTKAAVREPPTTAMPMLYGFRPHDGKDAPLPPGKKVRVLLRGEHLGAIVSYTALSTSSWNWTWGNPPWSSDIIAYRPEP